MKKGEAIIIATFSVSGFEEVEKELLRRSTIASEAVPAMLKAGADVLLKAQQSEISGGGLVRTGDLRNSIGIRKLDTSGITAAAVIGPKGKDRKGVRNAEKGFILEYGVKGNGRKKRTEPKRWMQEVASRGGDKAHEAMLKVWEDMNDDN